MKKVLKGILSITLGTVLFVVTFAFSAYDKFFEILGDDYKTAMASFALQGSSANEALSEDEVKKEIKEIRYIKTDGTIDTRTILICWPTSREGNIPLVYIPHYTVEENTADYVSYIKHGWAVASPYPFDNSYNGLLCTDDLVFNNAAMYTLRHMEGIDHQRIATVGGSAGGYMTLMINGLQMGTVASIASAPIANAYFNANVYFPACDEVNRNSGLFDLRMPIQCLVSESFQPANSIIGNDIARWEAVSPISMAKAYSNPLVMIHNTSDILVPVDQITHKYTYAENDGSLPEGFNCHLGSDYPGILSKTFEEMANPDEITINYTKYDDWVIEGELAYADTLITININDDGAPTAKGSHSNPKLRGAWDIFPFIEEMMDKGLAETEKLVPEKLILLLERYQGKSIALPAFEGVDDSLYGSLVIYQKEVVDEMYVWMDNHSEDEMNRAVLSAIDALVPETEKSAYLSAWEKILESK